MYRYDWIERLKLRDLPASSATRVGQLSPVVWALGLTSFLTDISSELVSSILPVYLALHLRLSPLQYGAIDGVYNGLSVALVSILAGVTADRWRRQKEVAAGGYALSAVCKLLLLAGGAAWGWIAAVLAFDRLGKGIRTAPRDALLSLNTHGHALGTAFGVHRAMDSAGALIGPLVAFLLLAQLPGDFDALWIVSFVVAFLGVSALWLFVPSAAAEAAPSASTRVGQARVQGAPLLSGRFTALALCAMVLALVTVSDGFVYLMLQQKSGTNPAFVPLFFVATAAAYMLFALPAGLAADHFGRRRVFIAGYAVLALLYVILLTSSEVSIALQIGCLLLLGLYYAGTEGILMAAASAVVPSARRTTGLAMIATCIGIGKLASSVLFGLAWQTYGAKTSLALFAGALPIVLVASAIVMRRW